MRGIFTYIFILFLTIAFAGNAIEKPYVFKKLNNQDGLSYNTVHDIAQEESGIIWFATKQGLNKYDSYHIERYYKEDKVGIPSNFTTCLLITKNNRLFIGTDKGLIEYNRRFNKFNAILYNESPLPDITSLTETSNGVILIGTLQGIFAYHPSKGTVVKFVSLQNDFISSILEWQPNEFLVTSHSGVCVVTSDGLLLEYYNQSNTASLPTNIIVKAYKDRDGNCWIGTNNSGLFLFDKEHKLFKRIRLAESEMAETMVVHDIEEDLRGNIWISGEQGIFILNTKTHQAINIQHSLEKSEYNLNDNATYPLFRSKEDIMWIGTYFGGVNYTNLNNSKGFYNIYPGDGKNELPGKAINKLYKDSKGILWIATEDGGVCSFDPKTKNIFNNWKKGTDNALSSNNIHAICEDRDGNIWFGHFMTGIDIYNPSNGNFRNISIRPDIKYSITQNSVYSIIKDSKGKIWVGTRLGVYNYDYQKDELIPFKQDDLGENFIYNITEDRTGRMWFCTRHGGIAYYDKDSDVVVKIKEYDGISTNKIIASTEDSAGRIWFGTANGGVNIYHPASDSFEVLTMENGLPNNTVYGILETGNGEFWLSTNQGLSMYNPKTQKFRNYNVNDGLAQMQFNYGSYFKDDDGTFYFGHIYGLTYFNPSEVSDDAYKTQVIFTDFKISNETVLVSDEGILKKPINLTEKISLSYFQKAFTIDFVAINHISAGNNRFYYYLEGFDEDWNDMGNKTSATYTNLLPGKYTFWLKAENNDGFESANIKSLEIRIRPPFYLSVGAFVMYLMLLAGLVLFFRKITIEKEKEKAALGIERMERQKMRELNQQRLNFYTYISHEFKTPLSIIISTIDQILNESNLSKDLLSRFQRLNRSSKRLSFLFNQLMDFRKIETKHAKLVLQKGDIIEFLRETCLVFSPLFDQQRVNFEFKANRNEYEYWFDPDKIEKIIANLISNALKHTPIHGRISCEATIIDDVGAGEQKSLSICIKDSGKGISTEDQENLFTPFYVNYQKDEQKSGSGIGLTLVKSLVEYLHGTIVVKSKLNEGTKFRIQLPLDYKGVADVKLENSNESVSRILDVESIRDTVSEPVQLKPKVDNNNEFKLLVVEDTVDLAEVLFEHYSKSFKVSYAQNGKEALKIVKDEEPDIIISDVMMPEMNGIEFCKKIKSDEATSHIAVILLTAKTTHEDKIAGLEAGAEAYVRKPFDFKELDLVVRNFIEIRKKLKEKVVTGGEINFDKLKLQSKDKEFIEKVSKIINENIEDESLNVEGLSKLLGLSRTMVYLKLKKLINMSVSDYILSIRLKKAIELMTDLERNISDVAYEVGFSDPNYFSKVFKKMYKKTPSAYRKELFQKLNNPKQN